MIVLLFVLLFALSSFLGLGLFDFLGARGRLGGGSLGGPNGSGDTTGFLADCPFLSDDEARAVLGGQADASLLEGLADASVGLIIDKRVLTDGQDCWITDGQKAYIARVALHQGGDSAQAFQAEKQAAQPKTTNQGGGVSTTTEGYFGGDVSGLGDEAFCTGLSPALMAGVLVRQDDRMVYASVGSETEGSQPFDLAPGPPDNALTSPKLCSLAQELARTVLQQRAGSRPRSAPGSRGGWTG